MPNPQDIQFQQANAGTSLIRHIPKYLFLASCLSNLHGRAATVGTRLNEIHMEHQVGFDTNNSKQYDGYDERASTSLAYYCHHTTYSRPRPPLEPT